MEESSRHHSSKYEARIVESRCEYQGGSIYGSPLYGIIKMNGWIARIEFDGHHRVVMGTEIRTEVSLAPFPDVTDWSEVQDAGDYYLFIVYMSLPPSFFECLILERVSSSSIISRGESD
jgi:hypothetical protein